jgi:hypothetical protein
MAQERRVSMTCSVLANRMRSSKSFAPNGSLKAASRHRPIAIDLEGFTVRVLFTVNNAGFLRVAR